MPEETKSAWVSTLLRAATDGGAAIAGVAAALNGLGLSASAIQTLSSEIDESRTQVERLRRREQELTGLISSARELAELRDADALLARLVKRAHEMMNGDVTYLSTYELRSRELRVLVTIGSVSAEFQHLRVPAGRGLASEVAETRAPQWASRYIEDQQVLHDHDIDDAVMAEGIQSILGVPMLSDDRVLGVLFVAYRQHHSFNPDEIALLSALADHASVVLQTAQTLEELSKSEKDARSTLTRLESHLAERDRSNKVHQELVQAVLAGGGFSQVAETLGIALGRAVGITDAHDAVIAASGVPLPESAMLDTSVRSALLRSRSTGHCEPITGAAAVEFVVAISAASHQFGALLVGSGTFELGSVDLRTLERAAQVCALLALQQDAAASADHRVQSDLIADLLDDVPARRADVQRRAQRLGVRPQHMDTLVLLAVPGEHRVSAARIASTVLEGRALVGEYKEFILIATAGGPDGVDAEYVRSRVSSGLGQPVLAVCPPRKTGDLAGSGALAVRTARLLSSLGINGSTQSTDSYYPYAALFNSDGTSLDAFLELTLGAVRSYDAERGTDLMGTLYAFVSNYGSPTRTARALNFHTNTILQRLERLDALLGAGWREDEKLFRVGLAVRLEHLRHPPGARQNTTRG